MGLQHRQQCQKPAAQFGPRHEMLAVETPFNDFSANFYCACAEAVTFLLPVQLLPKFKILLRSFLFYNADCRRLRQYFRVI